MIFGKLEKFIWLGVAGCAAFLCFGLWARQGNWLATSKIFVLVVIVAAVAAIGLFVAARLEAPNIPLSEMKASLIPAGVVVAAVFLIIMMGVL